MRIDQVQSVGYQLLKGLLYHGMANDALDPFLVCGNSSSDRRYNFTTHALRLSDSSWSEKLLRIANCTLSKALFLTLDSKTSTRQGWRRDRIYSQ